jgi:hypothetical protein
MKQPSQPPCSPFGMLVPSSTHRFKELAKQLASKSFDTTKYSPWIIYSFNGV